MGWWKSKVVYQMLSCCFCIFRNYVISTFTPPSSWIMVLPLALLLLFSSYYKLMVGFVFLFSLLFTSLSLLLSTFVLFMWKQHNNNNTLQQHGRDQSSVAAATIVAPTPMHKDVVETVVTQAKKSEEEQQEEQEQVSDSGECQEEEVLFLSTSDLDYEDEEVDHIHTLDECSDGTISDEDSLIEIALPSGHFVGHNHNHNQNKEESNSNSKYNNNNCCSLQQQKKALFNQQKSLMEFLAEFNEMNEEDNLIEIDIAMGSIKCSSSVKLLLFLTSFGYSLKWLLLYYYHPSFLTS